MLYAACGALGQLDRVSGGADRGADGGQPVGVAIDVRQLRSADVVVVEDGVHLSGDDPEAVATEHRAGVIAAVGKKSGRPRGDRALADGRRLGQDALDVDLVSPIAVLAD